MLIFVGRIYLLSCQNNLVTLRYLLTLFFIVLFCHICLGLCGQWVSIPHRVALLSHCFVQERALPLCPFLFLFFQIFIALEFPISLLFFQGWRYYVPHIYLCAIGLSLLTQFSSALLPSLASLIRLEWLS